jgi:amino acid permease
VNSPAVIVATPQHRRRTGREEIMHLPKRDAIATCLVGGAVVLYLLWATGSTLPGLSSARATGAAVLALGFVASASAVVPTFGQLLHGNRPYLAVTSLLGVVAVIAGVQMLVTGSGTGLTVVLAATVVLWLAATIHHTLLAKTALPSPADAQHPARHGPRPAGTH